MLSSAGLHQLSVITLRSSQRVTYDIMDRFRESNASAPVVGSLLFRCIAASIQREDRLGWCTHSEVGHDHQIRRLIRWPYRYRECWLRWYCGERPPLLE